MPAAVRMVPSPALNRLRHDRADIYMCPYKTAVAHLSRGDEAGRARAMELLFEAASLRSNCLIVLRVDPRM